MKLKTALVISALCGILAVKAFAVNPGTLTVDASKPGPKMGPLFYGLMTEEINHAYDGGLYAELIQNRIFQDAADPVQWSVVQSGSAAGTIAIDETNSVNPDALKRSLRLDVTAIGNGERAGVANAGYWGIPVWANTKYHAAFYARASGGFTGPLTVDIESNDGKTTFAIGAVPVVGTAWKKYELDLTTAQVATSTDNRFVISAGSKGSVWFSLVSLFPPTYHDRPNGNRIDLMNKMADLHPSFLRFPGGNYLEGDTVATRFQWKKTIGALEDRPGHMGCWSYRSSDGLGLQEFLNWCEDLKMEPLLAVYAGYSLKQDHVQPGKDLEPFVQEALDEIEYCIGDVSTPWGKRRADGGHPTPYDIHYIEIGNEDWFDHSNTYDGRFAQIFDAIKAKYPKLLCIATAPVKTRRPDLYDDHAYPHSRDMLRMVDKYDHPDPNRPKVFFGEWATQEGQPTPNMKAALADAAWLTGLQRDCDTVQLNCYAPLFVNVNKKAWQWPTNLIGYDAASSFGSPSFYAQSMFSRNWGNTVLPLKLESQKVEIPAPPASKGGIGVGTWHTKAEFKDIKVTQDDKSLFQSDFSAGTRGWRPTRGKWETNNGTLSQTDGNAEDHITFNSGGDWQDYTLSLKARKISGNEGFLVMFHVTGRNDFLWLNLGGWSNSKTGIQEMVAGGAMTPVGADSPFIVESDKWYDIRVELKGSDIKCFVDDKLILQATEAPVLPKQTLFAGATRIDSTGAVILKVVNVINAPQQIQIDLQGLPEMAKQATIETLQGDSAGQNTVEEPTKIVPQEGKIDDAGSKFMHEFPANSVSVIRLTPA